MKFLFSVIFISGYIPAVLAQGTIRIMPGAHLKGNNDAQITLSNMLLDNKGTITDETSFRIGGDMTTSIGGNGSTTIKKITVAKSSNASTILQSNIIVNGDFIFSGGLLDLGNYHIDLGTEGKLVNESPLSRAVTNGTGYIQATRILNQPVEVNPGHLGAIITSDKNMGLTIIRRGHQIYPNVNGNAQSIARYYDIQPQHNIALKATLKFQYFDEELNGFNENLLDQYKSKNPNEWDYVGADLRSSTSNYVLRNNISKFSKWTLSGSTALLTTNRSSNETIFEGFSSFNVKLWPNPSSSQFNLLIENYSAEKPVVLNILTISGQLISTQLIQDRVINFGTSLFPGVYLLEIKQGDSRKVLKLVKQ